MTVATALLVAAGSGKRFGSSRSKILLPLSHLPLFAWSLSALAASPSVERILMAVRAEDRADVLAALEAHPCEKLESPLVPGGDARSGSVRNLLAQLTDDPPRLVVIHDAARPFLSIGAVDAVIAAAAKHRCATLAHPATDTLRRAGQDGMLREPVPREGLWAVQTPQAFDYAALVEAYERWPSDAPPPTDETTVMAAAGIPCQPVEVDYFNLKITHPQDLAVAEALLDWRGRS